MKSQKALNRAFSMLVKGKHMKAKNYRTAKGMPYTRKEYIGGFPPPKIVKFTMGDTKAKFEYQGLLIAQKEAQVRHNALEAARIAVNRLLQEKLGSNYVLRILPYPHSILRENKMIFGAHADRLQDGMKKSFGKAIGTAARIKPNQKIMQVGVNRNSIETAKQALKRGKAKLPFTCRIVIEKTPD